MHNTLSFINKFKFLQLLENFLTKFTKKFIFILGPLPIMNVPQQQILPVPGKLFKYFKIFSC